MHFQYVATNFTTLHIPAKQLDIISETIERKNPTIHPREEQGGNKRKKKLTPFFRATIGLRRTRYNPGQIYLFRAMINFIPIAPPPQILTSFLPFQNEEVVTMDSHAPYCVMGCNLRTRLLTSRAPRKFHVCATTREKPQRIGIRAET